MVKGAFYQAYRANTAREAEDYFQKLVDEWGYPVILQQVVSGEEMNVVGVGDGAGGNVGQVGIKKTSVTSLGKIWTGITVKNEFAIFKAGLYYLSGGGFHVQSNGEAHMAPCPTTPTPDPRAAGGSSIAMSARATCSSPPRAARRGEQ